MCLAAEELIGLCRLRRLPHELLEQYTLDELGFAAEVMRAAKKYRATESAADMEQLAEGDDLGVGRVLAMLYRQFVMGGG